MADELSRGGIDGYLQRRWQGRLAETASNPTPGVAAEELVGGDPERVALILINLSVNIIYVSPRNDVSAINGIRLNANGGSLTLTPDDDGVLVSRPWFALATGAASQMYVLQVRRVTGLPAE